MREKGRGRGAGLARGGRGRARRGCSPSGCSPCPLRAGQGRAGVATGRGSGILSTSDAKVKKVALRALWLRRDRGPPGGTPTI